MTAQLKPYNQKNLPSLKVHLLERRISCMTVASIVEAIHTACVADAKITVANYNVHSFNLSMQLPWFYNFLQTAEIAHCDGFGIIKAVQWMGKDLPQDYRVSYSVLMPYLLEHCNQQGFSIFLLGAKPDTLDDALENMRCLYPNIKFDGHHGYFDKDSTQENLAVIKKINQIKPNIIIVGMGMPIQENWLRRYRDLLDVNVMLPGGAIIDRLAGIVSDCPKFISNLGLEWLYRLLREPKRLAARYLLGNPAFLLHIALGKFYASPVRVEQMPPMTPATLKTKDTLHLAIPNELLRRDKPHKRLGDYLIEAGLVNKVHIDFALSEQKATGLHLGEILISKGWIRRETIEFFLNQVVVPASSRSY
ncbi:MAG: WecB/TagA/CpsF family glycosyltransferase [Nostocaceae cyanobacterium]|nr:WecB/TagA/CpsF family glycosyltransferase [Nostocaceae cyanobacterium]